MSMLDELLPPAREFRWAVLETPPPLRYPVKPYRYVNIAKRIVVDANGDGFNFTVTNERITQWSNQFQIAPTNVPLDFWRTLTQVQRIRIRKRWEQKQLDQVRKKLKAARKNAILTGHF
jgi:hypothetical protein